MPTFSTAFLLVSLTRSVVASGASLAQELTELQRGMHARSLGYFDVGQMQSLAPVERMPHAAYGELAGFREVRRVTGVLMGPDSAANNKIGLMGSWQGGGWTRDLYLTSPPALHRNESRWGLGIAGARVDQNWFAAGGWFRLDPVEWKGDRGFRVEDARNEFWGAFRWKRWGLLTMGGPQDWGFARASYFSDPTPFKKYDRNWFWPQCEAALVWSQAAFNPWSASDALGAELRAPLLGERVAMRLDAGSDGFRLAQIQSNLDPQGNVGVDLSWSESQGAKGPGIRFRAPLFTFSWNDPEDVAAFGMSRRGMVWSLRLVMTWENSQMWYRPGRRPDAGGSL